MKKISSHIKVFFLALSIIFTLYCSAQTGKDTIKPGRANDPMNVKPGKANDQMALTPRQSGMEVMSDTGFIVKNILDNRQEIQLSKLALSKATSPAVKKAATTMLADHTAILAELTKLAAQKGKAPIRRGELPMPSFNHAEGEAFDRAWASEMLTMHEAKITELESFLSITKDPALKTVVMRAIPKIKTHINLLSAIPGAKEKGKTQTI